MPNKSELTRWDQLCAIDGEEFDPHEAAHFHTLCKFGRRTETIMLSCATAAFASMIALVGALIGWAFGHYYPAVLIVSAGAALLLATGGAVTMRVVPDGRVLAGLADCVAMLAARDDRPVTYHFSRALQQRLASVAIDMQTILSGLSETSPDTARLLLVRHRALLQRWHEALAAPDPGTRIQIRDDILSKVRAITRGDWKEFWELDRGRSVPEKAGMDTTLEPTGRRILAHIGYAALTLTPIMLLRVLDADLPDPVLAVIDSVLAFTCLYHFTAVLLPAPARDLLQGLIERSIPGARSLTGS